MCAFQIFQTTLNVFTIQVHYICEDIFNNVAPTKNAKPVNVRIQRVGGPWLSVPLQRDFTSTHSLTSGHIRPPVGYRETHSKLFIYSQTQIRKPEDICVRDDHKIE